MFLYYNCNRCTTILYHVYRKVVSEVKAVRDASNNFDGEGGFDVDICCSHLHKRWMCQTENDWPVAILCDALTPR